MLNHNWCAFTEISPFNPNWNGYLPEEGLLAAHRKVCIALHMYNILNFLPFKSIYDNLRLRLDHAYCHLFHLRKYTNFQNNRILELKFVVWIRKWWLTSKNLKRTRTNNAVSGVLGIYHVQLIYIRGTITVQY